MRLHQLTITAFGPFAGTVTLDGDACSTAGLFGLAGPTGAGKSSILDALCFALYGDVPGHRQGSRTLRSHHSAATQHAEVAADVTISGRRFCITRSPEWQRPKKRGTGTVKEPTHVSVAEYRNQEWVPITSRVDEAATLIRHVIGLSKDQFTKVVMLPQGDFAAFLQANEKERRALLESLFGTARFADVAAWFAEQRRALRHDVNEASGHLAQIVSAARQGVIQCADPRATALVHTPEPQPAATTNETPAGTTAHQGPETVPTPAEHTSPQATVQHWATTVAAWHTEAVATSAAAKQHATAAEDAYWAVTATLQTYQNAAAAVDRLQALAQGTDRMAAAQEQIRRHIAAAPLLAVIDTAQAANDRAADAQTALGQQLRQWRTPPELTNDPLWTEPATISVTENTEDTARMWQTRHQQLLALTAETETAENLEHDTAAAAAAAATAGATAQAAQRTEQATADARVQATTAVTETEARATAIAQHAANLPYAQKNHDQARAAYEAARAADTATQDVASATERHTQAQLAAQHAATRWDHVRARRLAGMAAELATQLQPGHPCQVCGATTHPLPAQPAPDRFTQADEAEAETAAKNAATLQEATATDLATATNRLEAARGAAAGMTTDHARTAWLAAQTELTVCTEAAANQPHAQQQLAEAKDHLQLAEQHDTAAQRATIEATAHATATANDAQKLTQQRDAARGQYPTVTARVAAYQAAAQAAQRIYDAAGTAHAAKTEATRAVGEVHDRLSASASTATVFATAEDVHQATLDDAALADLEHRISEHTKQWHHARNVLHDTAVTGAHNIPTDPPTTNTATTTVALTRLAHHIAERLTDLTAQVSTAEEQATISRTAAETAYATCSALANATTELARHATQAADIAATLGPAHDALTLHNDLAQCLEGTGGGNILGMSLSSFVLAAQLESVVDAANARLGAMTAGRFLLEHTDAKAKGARRAGLGLVICDAWTGENRPPNTLSGGEMFVTSLALALGLADVVVAEAGGHHLETLFIDEGFGSLDANTLDDVMAILDDLRDSGRVVGVISHVPEVKQRLGYVVTVDKTRTGSRLICP